MDDSRQWRLRADLCRKVAGQMGDHWAADCLRSMADEYLAHAAELEADENSETPSARYLAGLHRQREP